LKGRESPARVKRWLFYAAAGASWLLGAEIVVLTAARTSIPGRLPATAGWFFVFAVAVAVVAMSRLEMMGRHKTSTLLDQLEEALGSITALTEASLSSLELPTLLDRLLEQLFAVLHAEIGAILLLDPSETELHAVATRGIEETYSASLCVRISDNDGLIERVVMTESPVATVDDRDIAVLSKRSGHRLLSAAACPIVVEGHLIGVCVAGSSRMKEFDERELHLMQLVADRSGLGIERRRLDEAERRSRIDAERAHRFTAVLAASSIVLATARDQYENNLKSLFDVVVPFFSDWCAIDLVDERGSLARLGTRHVVDQDELSQEALRPCIPSLDEFGEKMLQTGQTQLSPAFHAMVSSPGNPLSYASDEDRTPWVMVPIVTDKGIVGGLTFAFDGGASAITAEVVSTAEDIGRRVAMTMDRVGFYQEARETADHSRRVASQLQQLLDASLEVSKLFDASSVISAIAGIALGICDAAGALVTVRAPDEPGSGMRAIAEREKPIRVGDLELSIDRCFPVDVDLLSETTRYGELLATPIMGVDGARTGSLTIWRTDGLDFNKEDETLLVLLAQTASTTLSSVDLYRTIQASEARWRTLIETAPIGVMEVEASGGAIRWANRFALDIFESDIDCLNRKEAGPSKSRVNLGQFHPLWSLAATGVEIRDRELNEILIGDQKKVLFVSVVPLYGSDAAVRSILTLVADISDRRRLEGDLRQAQRMEAVGQLAGNVAHDFNNLLTLISGYTELLLIHDVMDTRQRDLVGNIQGVTDRAALLTGRLLTISRREVARPEALDPVAALTSMMEVLGRILGPNINLVHDFEGYKGTLSIDPEYFDQVILNLATNARDAMEGIGVFSLSLRRDGEMIELTVRDTGSGMDEETTERCFEPFFTTKGPSKGTGLGLAAVRSVIIDSRGSISVESIQGVGTSFIIRFPLAAESSDEPVEKNAARTSLHHINATILVAEDDESLRAMIAKVLTQAGYRVLSASAGDLALDIAKSNSDVIGLLVTDVSMPGMNGHDLARHVEEISPSASVLFISSDMSGIAIAPSRTAQTSFLAKPFRPSELLARVQQMLDARGDLEGVVASS